MTDPEGQKQASRTPLLANRPFIIGLLFVLGPWTGFSVFVGATLAYIFRSREHEAWEASHFQFLIRTFWIGFTACVILVPAALILFARTHSPFWMVVIVLLMALVIVFTSARSIISMMLASAGKPVPNPSSLTFGN